MTYFAYVLASSDAEATRAQLCEFNDNPEVRYCYVEESVSGALKTLKRPKFAEIHRLLRRGDTLITPALGHIGINVAELAEIFRTLKRKKVNIISTSEGFDLSSETGSVVFELFTTLADLEAMILGRGNEADLQRINERMSSDVHGAL